MTKIIQFPILAAFRDDSGELLDSLPEINHEIASRLVVHLSEQAPGIMKVVLGDRFVTGTKYNIDEKPIRQIMNDIDDLAIVSVDVFEEKLSSAAFPKFDGLDKYNYTGFLPVAVEVEDDAELSDFVAFTKNDMQWLYQLYEPLELFAIGFGNPKELQKTFNIDFDCLFSIGSALGVVSKEDQFELTESIQTLVEDVYIIPFFSLSSFMSNYGADKDSVLDRFTERMRLFRATLKVFDILNIRYRTIKGVGAWLTNPISEKEAANYVNHPDLPALVEEHFLVEKMQEKTTLPAVMRTFEDASSGVVCSIVNYMDEGNVQIVKVISPVKYEDVEALKEVENELSKRFASFKSHLHMLDDQSEKIMMDMINQDQNILPNKS